MARAEPAAELDRMGAQHFVDDQHRGARLALGYAQVGSLAARRREADQVGMAHRVERVGGERRAGQGDELQPQQVAAAGLIALHQPPVLQSREQAPDRAGRPAGHRAQVSHAEARRAGRAEACQHAHGLAHRLCGTIACPRYGSYPSRDTHCIMCNYFAHSIQYHGRAAIVKLSAPNYKITKSHRACILLSQYGSIEIACDAVIVVGLRLH